MKAEKAAEDDRAEVSVNLELLLCSFPFVNGLDDDRGEVVVKRERGESYKERFLLLS